MDAFDYTWLYNSHKVTACLIFRIGSNAWSRALLWYAFLSHSHQHTWWYFWRTCLCFYVQVAASSCLFLHRSADFISVVSLVVFSLKFFIKDLVSKLFLIIEFFMRFWGVGFLWFKDVGFGMFIKKMFFGGDVFLIVFGWRCISDMLSLKSDLIAERIQFRSFLFVFRVH